jgi:hypothetical protein
LQGRLSCHQVAKFWLQKNCRSNDVRGNVENLIAI